MRSLLRGRARLFVSLPVWGAWVEMVFLQVGGGGRIPSLPVWGAWVEIPYRERISRAAFCRSPCGERGLKSALPSWTHSAIAVAPRVGSVG